MKKILTLTMLLCLCVFASSCKSSSRYTMGKQTFQENVLRVGVDTSMVPMAFEKNGKIQGMEIDFANKLGAELDKQPEFVKLGWNDLIPALKDKKIDIIMSGMSITVGREQKVNFTTPYLVVGQMVLVREKDSASYNVMFPVTAMKGKVGVLAGTTSEGLINRRFLDATKVTFTGTEEAIKALKRGRIDAFVADAQIIWYAADRHSQEGLRVLQTPLTTEYLAWAVRLGDTKLLGEINEVIKKLDKEGWLQNTIAKWLPQMQQEIASRS